jgi:hypothetical protein
VDFKIAAGRKTLQMTVALLLVAAALAAMALLWRATRAHSVEIAGLDDLEGKTQPVDLAAFRNLIEPSEEAFLRENLEIADFRRVQRARMQAALQYVRRANDNAAVLLKLGELARRNPDVQVARAGTELVDNAVRLRLYALLAQLVLVARIAMPGLQWSPGRIQAAYGTAADAFGHLCRLQRPADAPRLVASF